MTEDPIAFTLLAEAAVIALASVSIVATLVVRAGLRAWKTGKI
jgi:hypothetical protein